MIYTAFIVFSFSIIQALVSTLLSVILALPVAHFFYTFNFPGKRFVISLVSMLCIMPTKLVVLCVTLFYGVNGFVGIILAHVILNVPLTVYIINATYQKLDVSLLWLAADSGACPWRSYKDVVFPLLRPTIVSIFLLLFLLHFSSFSIPLLLGGKIFHNTPEIMLYKMYSDGNSSYAFIYWIIRLMIILPLFFLHNRYAIAKTKISSIPTSVKRNVYSPFFHSIWWLLYCGFVAIMILGPLASLVVRACDIKIFEFFKYIISGGTDLTIGIAIYHVIVNSVLLAIVSGLGAVLVAFLIGIIEFKWSRRFPSIISFITIFAFILGSVGTGILFSLMSYGKIFSSFLIGALCHMFLNYAFAYRIVRAQLILYHPDIHRTAQTYGATLKKAIWTFAFPFVLPAIYRAFCVSFGLSLTEVGAGAILQSKIGLTLPMAIGMYRKAGNQEAVIGLSLILLLLVLFVTYLFTRVTLRE